MSYNIAIKPKCYSLIVAPGSVYADNLVTFPGIATFCQIFSSQTVSVQLNGDSGAVFTLLANTGQVFNGGEVHLTSVSFASPMSGMNAANVEIIAGVVTV